jgi:hypothetical protein
MRVAETRAVNRALRKAYGIGVCSIEEIGSAPRPEPPAQILQLPTMASDDNGTGHRLRVKRYAIDYCGVQELREASRDQIEAFARHLAEYAEKDPAGLACELNGYAANREAA